MLCDRIAIMDDGKIVAEGTPRDLKKKVAGDCITIGIENQKEKAPKLISILEKTNFIREIKQDNDSLRLYVKDGAKAIPEVLRLLDQNKINLVNITLSAPSLDDVFLSQTGHSLRDTGAKVGDK